MLQLWLTLMFGITWYYIYLLCKETYDIKVQLHRIEELIVNQHGNNEKSTANQG